MFHPWSHQTKVVQISSRHQVLLPKLTHVCCAQALPPWLLLRPQQGLVPVWLPVEPPTTKMLQAVGWPTSTTTAVLPAPVQVCHALDRSDCLASIRGWDTGVVPRNNPQHIVHISCSSLHRLCCELDSDKRHRRPCLRMIGSLFCILGISVFLPLLKSAH